ncbi:hypothetical protein M378DRAFT_16837 [Amanita muscaria Koide BX008]|uniref:Uncharacterized protein n=1 Tax=Amanita muscaria (strain Koide BX008) TaxID=946122 RepID=A0A0C2S228_AMAMK|nr:hypothetical protein M378DRAFT_16837 [Amanita muscaria Koide BX008]
MTNNDSSVVVVTSSLPRRTFSAPLALAEPRLTATSPEVTLMTDVGERTDVSLASSASVHEQVGSSDVPPSKNTQGSSLRAIVHATRVMTSDYGSVLVDYGRRGKDNEKLKDTKNDNKFRSLSMGEAAMTLRAVASSTARDKDEERQASRGGRGNHMQQVASPLFGTLRSSNREDHHSSSCSIPGSGAAITTSATTVNASTPTKRSSVPLESIIPVSAKPPIQYLSKSAISNSSTSKPNSSAARPAVPAPACITGIKIADRQEGNNWLWDAFLKQRGRRAEPVQVEQPHHASSFTGGSA